MPPKSLIPAFDLPQWSPPRAPLARARARVSGGTWARRRASTLPRQGKASLQRLPPSQVLLTRAPSRRRRLPRTLLKGRTLWCRRRPTWPREPDRRRRSPASSSSWVTDRWGPRAYCLHSNECFYCFLLLYLCFIISLYSCFDIFLWSSIIARMFCYCINVLLLYSYFGFVFAMVLLHVCLR